VRTEAEKCPSKDVLSAYFDGELMPKWRARVEGHLVHCSACRGVLLEFSRVRDYLARSSEPQFVDAMARVRNHLPAGEAVQPLRQGLLSRRLSVPIPLALAAALAVLALGLSLLMSFARRPASTVRFTAAPSGHTQFEIEGDPEDVSRLLQALNQDSPNRIVTFDIPADIPLIPMGAPKLRPAVSGGGR
jgi:anti-sigma factor RsiW